MENEFEKYFQERLEHPPEFPFEERLWEDMSARLDHYYRQRGPSWWRRWWPLLLIGLIPTVISLFLYQKHQADRQKLTLLTQQLHEQSTKLDSLLQRPTTTVVRDTVYRTVIVEERVQPSLALSPAFTPSGTTGLMSGLPAPRPFTDRLSDDISIRPAANSEQADEHQVIATQRTAATGQEQETPPDEVIPADAAAVWNIPLAALATRFPDTLAYAYPPPALVVELPEQERQRKRLPDYLRPVQPTYLALAATAGPFWSLNLSEHESCHCYGGAIRAEIGYAFPLRLVTGGELLNQDFQLHPEDEEEHYEHHYPVLPPNDPADQLHEVYGNFRYLQLPLGLQYRFAEQRAFSPYLGAGVMATRPLRSSLQYEYRGPGYDYYISGNDWLPKELALTDAWATAGLQWQWSTHWRLMLEGTYQWRVAEAPYAFLKHQLVQLRAGLGYQF
ncbi:MAG: hypothetical protein KDC54_25280 [Lewinella sp.]|nr:hypothetical protein [Lewinella sp.]